MDRAELRRLAEAVSKFYDNPVYSTNESGVWDKYVDFASPAAIIELLDEIESLKCCGNCRHYSQGYSVDCCVKDCGHGEKETRRGNTCRDWEMI